MKKAKSGKGLIVGGIVLTSLAALSVGAVAIASGNQWFDWFGTSQATSSTQTQSSSAQSASDSSGTGTSIQSQTTSQPSSSSTVEPYTLNFPTDTTVQGSSLSTDSLLLTFLNAQAPSGASFVSVIQGQYGDNVTSLGFSKCYKDNGGLKLGTSTALGFFCVQSSREFNKVVITGHAFGEASTITSEHQTQTYSCDASGISVNGLNGLMFGANTSDTTLPPPTESKEFDLGSATQTLYVSAVSKRATILSIRLMRTA